MFDVKFLVVTAIGLALGVYVFFAVMGNIPVDAENNETITSIKTNFTNAFKLTAIIGIVLGAAWVLKALNIY